MRKYLPLLLLVLCCVAALPVQAHANLENSTPLANASLNEAPSEIRLRFTEPIEPSFSRIILRDATGTTVKTAASSADPDDSQQMVLPLTALADGLYTVSWRVVSAADGHSTEGSFAFGVNISISSTAAAPASINDSVSLTSVIIRTFQFIAGCLAIGSLGAWCFLWQPLAKPHAAVERVLFGLMWLGWGLLGAASVLFLLLQTSTTADIPLGDALTNPALGNLLSQTTFGGLWLLRMAIWLAWGVVLFISRTHDQSWTALGLGGGFLLAQSLFSHASATQQLTAITADWLHLLATTLWVGGLVGFAAILITLRREKEALTGMTSRLVAVFSNYARLCVAVLIITGLYAAWLHVGSVDALLNTRYGQALTVKLLLFAPLLVLAAINLIWTHRQLQRGAEVWVGRLRGLIGAEITLTCGILIAAAVMTSGSPARGIQALRDAAAAAPPAPEPYFNMVTIDDLMIHLSITPGTVGQNTFQVSLSDVNGKTINDASLIRLRFDNLDEDYGQSELRPAFTQNGEYVANGANLSAPGKWRIRMSIQRPGQFDTVKDFEVTAALPPAAPPAPDLTLPLSEETLASALAGLALLALGGFLGGWHKQPGLMGGRILAAAALVLGAIFLLSAADALTQSGSLSVSDVVARPASAGTNTAVYLTLTNQTPLSEQLVGLETSVAARATIHETQVENDVAQMVDVETLEIQPFSTVRIDPGHLHIMLEDLKQDLDIGQSFDLVLIMASGTRIPLIGTVTDQ